MICLVWCITGMHEALCYHSTAHFYRHPEVYQDCPQCIILTTCDVLPTLNGLEQDPSENIFYKEIFHPNHNVFAL